MDINIVISVLQNGSYNFVKAQRYKNYAWRIQLANGVAVFCGDKGSIWYKGKQKETVKLYLDNNLPPMKNDKVFVVYGRDIGAKDAIASILRKWGIEPLLFDELPFSGRTAIEQLEHYIPQANYGIIIATPDDKGRLKSDNEKETYRLRQNVVFEMGMLFSKLGRKRIAILKKKSDDLEMPSDIDGVQSIEFSETVAEVGDKLKKELNAQGYNIV